ncbi:hypothetical protein ACEQUB_00263 [Ralstonia syzygii]
MNDDQLLRYSRHILLDEIGIEGQSLLLAAHVLVIGAGGLGAAALPYLAAAGIGTLTIVDDDSVDLTNLQRQIIHTTESVGHPKVESARQAIARLNPEVRVHTVRQRLDADGIGALLDGVTVVLDCSDNFATRQAANQACVRARVPLVSGAAIRFDGQISVFDSRAGGPATPACSRPTNPLRMSPARPWACSRRWSAWSGQCRRRKRSSWQRASDDHSPGAC